ncbi:putative sensor-like histidine kinase [compost metagenome]
MNLRIKLLTAFILLIIIPIFVLGIITFLVTFRSIESKYSEQAEYALKSIGFSINSVFTEIDNVTRSGSDRELFQNALSSSDPKTQNLTNEGQIELNANQTSFRTLLYNHPAIDYAFLYNLNTLNNLYSYKNYESIKPFPVFDKEGFTPLTYLQLKNHPVYKEVMKLNGRALWIAPHEYPELTGSEPVFTQIRVIKKLSNLHKMGILAVQIKNWEIDDIFKNLQIGGNQRDTRFFLVNNKGLVLYDNKDAFDGTSINKYVNETLSYGGKYQSFKGKFGGQESVISIYHLKEHPWSIVSVTSWSYLSNEVMTFAKWFVGILAIFVVTAVMFNVFFMNRITGTIGVIVRFMRKAEAGDLGARVDEKGDDELLLLQKGFNNQMDKISQLFDQVRNEQEKKTNAELRVLQAQIKPHFLFNTLESINALAIQNQGKKVSGMVLRLASILRISFQGKEEIPLRQELEHVINYLEIQKFRFEDVFDYSLEIPEELMNCLVLKLTIQPLVENCIQHGFEGIEYKGHLKITGWTHENRIVLRIEDNGIGMTSKQLSSLKYFGDSENDHEIKVEPQGTLVTNQERRGLGLRSVMDRIRFQYGARYGLFICSAPGHGTIIQCVIPKNEWGDKL